jgi:aryl-alcohol dehydrogenase-like predicted oxidoreductase
LRYIASVRIALGCMRLSTESTRDDEGALDTLAAALDAGVRIFDTARSYALDARDLGHNEKLLAQALKSRTSRLCMAAGCRAGLAADAA